jgi:hypothetical protein
MELGVLTLERLHHTTDYLSNTLMTPLNGGWIGD